MYKASTSDNKTGLVPADHLQLAVEGELAPAVVDGDTVSEDKATELFDAEGNKTKVARVVRVCTIGEGRGGERRERAREERGSWASLLL